MIFFWTVPPYINVWFLYFSDSTDFSLELVYNSVNCDVRREGGGFSADLVIQHHDLVVTNEDIGYTSHTFGAVFVVRLLDAISS